MPVTSFQLAFATKTPYEKDAFDIAKKLQEAHFATFFVGGFARDLLLKRKRADIDIATQAAPRLAKKVLKKYRIVSRDERFGTLRLVVRGGVIELTTFRKESLYEKRRRPKKVDFIKKVEQDASRRDFTINALFYDPVSSNLFDFTGGLSDVRRKLIRCVGDPKTRFSEDALRMLRAFRFQAQLGFAIEKKTLRDLGRKAPLIQEISHERLHAEFEKLIMGKFASKALRSMHDSHLLKYILPEIFILSSVKQNPEYHLEGDVFTHTLLALDKLPKDASPLLRYAVLFHDVGKSSTTQEVVKEGKRKIVSYGHEVAGANMVSRILGESGLRLDKVSITKIQWLVRNHMIVYQLPEMKMSKQMSFATHKWFPDLLQLDRADDLGRKTKDRDPLKPYKYGRKLLKKARKATHNQSLEKFLKTIVTGNDVKKILKIGDGPKVGNVLREIRQLFYQGKVLNHTQAIEHLKTKRFIQLHDHI